MSCINIAIDGPAGAGKSTISKTVAQKLGFTYIDTGAMYRAVGLKMLRSGIDIKADLAGVLAVLNKTELNILHTAEGQRIYLDGQDVTEEIRTPEVSVAASDVSAIKEVRLKLVEMQQKLAKDCNCIMDGRDIGTHVLPNAELKIFLTASAKDRAQRRYEELLQKGMDVNFDDVLRDMQYRDKNDSTRAFAPLKPADDSILTDTSGNTLEQSVALILGMVEKYLKENCDGI